MRWFTRWWWAYLFERPCARGIMYGSDEWFNGWPRRLWCRMRGHPAGPWYYNPGGMEPDWHCKNCGDELG